MKSPYLQRSSQGYSRALGFHPLLDSRVTTLDGVPPFESIWKQGQGFLDKAQGKADRLELAIKALLVMGAVNIGLTLWQLRR